MDKKDFAIAGFAMKANNGKRAPRKLFTSCKPEESILTQMGFWLSTSEVAKVLGGCSRETVRALRGKGAIASLDFRVPGTPKPEYRFYKESVRQFIHARKKASTDA